MLPETKKKIISVLVTAAVAGAIAFLAKLVDGLGGLDLSFLDLKTAFLAALTSRSLV